MKREINAAARWLVIAVSVAGILAAAATLLLIWTTTAGLIQFNFGDDL
jgi:hypothetical protein